MARQVHLAIWDDWDELYWCYVPECEFRTDNEALAAYHSIPRDNPWVEVNVSGEQEDPDP